MHNKKPLFAMLALGAVLFIALFLAQQMLRESSTITLPEYTAETEAGTENSGAENLNVLSITPQTVQAAVATLSRPTTYQRTQTITLYWDGGERSTDVKVAIKGNVMRIDTTRKDGTTCHTLLVNNTYAVWYDEETTWTQLKADRFSSDILQYMPTYESVLTLPVEQITQADYCLKDGIYCIHIETAPDEEGYADNFWISTQSGLLLAAERTYAGEIIYRFSAGEPTGDTPSEELFLLPDGSVFQP